MKASDYFPKRPNNVYRNFTIVGFIFGILYLIGYLLLLSAIVYVAIHFLLKFW